MRILLPHICTSFLHIEFTYLKSLFFGILSVCYFKNHKLCSICYCWILVNFHTFNLITIHQLTKFSYCCSICAYVFDFIRCIIRLSTQNNFILSYFIFCFLNHELSLIGYFLILSFFTFTHMCIHCLGHLPSSPVGYFCMLVNYYSWICIHHTTKFSYLSLSIYSPYFSRLMSMLFINNNIFHPLL
jgi:hypothetical protein